MTRSTVSQREGHHEADRDADGGRGSQPQAWLEISPRGRPGDPEAARGDERRDRARPRRADPARPPHRVAPPRRDVLRPLRPLVDPRSRQHQRHARQRRDRARARALAGRPRRASATTPRLLRSSPRGRRPTPSRSAITYEDEQPTARRLLVDFEPPRLAAGHLHTLLEFSQRLIAMARPADERLDALCELMVRQRFPRHGRGGAPPRAGRHDHPALADVHARAQSSPPEQPYISRRVLAKVRETNARGDRGQRQRRRATSQRLRRAHHVARGHGALGRRLPAPRRRGSRGTCSTPRSRPTAAAPSGCSSSRSPARSTTRARRRGPRGATPQAHAAIERELRPRGQSRTALVPKTQKLDFTGLRRLRRLPALQVGRRRLRRRAARCPTAASSSPSPTSAARACRRRWSPPACTPWCAPPSTCSPRSRRSIERVNRHLCDWLPPHSFVTMVAVAVDPETGEIECVNAGHPPVLVVDRDGDLRALQSAENPALGHDPTRMEPRSATLLEFGDVLAMYTDGLTELRNPPRRCSARSASARSSSASCPPSAAAWRRSARGSRPCSIAGAAASAPRTIRPSSWRGGSERRARDRPRSRCMAGSSRHERSSP